MDLKDDILLYVYYLCTHVIIHLPVGLSVRPSICPSVRPSDRLCTCLSVRLRVCHFWTPIHSTVCLSIRRFGLSIHLPIHPYVHPSINLSDQAVHQFICVCPSDHLDAHLSPCPSDYPSFCISVHPCICLTVGLPIHHPSACPIVCPSVCLTTCPSRQPSMSVHPSACPIVCLSVCLTTCPSIRLCAHPSVSLSIHLSICLSVHYSRALNIDNIIHERVPMLSVCLSVWCPPQTLSTYIRCRLYIDLIVNYIVDKMSRRYRHHAQLQEICW